MEEKKRYSGKNVNEAITNACTSLGVPSTRIEYRVVQQPSNGFLGIGSRQAVIEAWIKAVPKKEEEKPENLPFKKAAAEPDNAGKKSNDSAGKTVSLKAEAEEKAPAVKKNAAVPAAEDAAEKKAQAKTDRNEKNAAGKNSFSSMDVSDVNFVSADEIEKRAAAAAEYVPDEESKTERPERSGYDRRGRRLRRGERRGSYQTGRNTRRNADKVNAVNNEPHKPSEPKPERVVKDRSDEEISKIKEAAEGFLKDVLSAMNIPCEIESSYDPKTGTVSCVLNGSDMGILIGKRGQTLDALQYLTGMAVNKNTDDYVRVKLDTEDYRERREETLRNLARSIAYRVRNSGEPFALEPMNPYERRIIHSALQGNRYVMTYSEGEEPHRHVIIAPKRR